MKQALLRWPIPISEFILWTFFEILMCLKVIFHNFLMPNRFLVRFSAERVLQNSNSTSDFLDF